MGASRGERVGLFCSTLGAILLVACNMALSARRPVLSDATASAVDLLAFALLLYGLSLGLFCRRSWRGVVAALISVAVLGFYVCVFLLVVSER